MSAKPASILAVLIFALSSPTHGAEQAEDFIGDGSASLDLRYRFESVDEDTFEKNARASLLRSRLTLESGTVRGWQGLLEIDDVRSIGADSYNSTENSKTEYPTVADPEGTDLNQLWISYEREDLSTHVGRQRILLGDMRFIGGKPWRQNEQTYDGIRLQWSPTSALSIDASYVNRVNRIFGPDDGGNPSDWKGDNLFARAQYRVADAHELAAFAYRVDVDPQAGFTSGQTVNNSSDSVGIEYEATLDTLSFRAAIAQQRDAGASTLSYRAPYYVVEASTDLLGLKWRAAHEVLGADNGIGFATPLANGHRYQGWADKFLSTPGDGLEDTWISLETRRERLGLTLRYHDFRAESSNTRFGQEVDLQLQWTVNPRLTATFKAAVFDSDAPERYNNTTKAWLMLQFRI
jgi:hypothetical protein